MKTKRKKLITVMIGIILLISQQIIAGTDYTKTVTSTGGTVSATEFDATRIIAGGIAKWNNLRIKNGETVTIDFSGIPDIQSVEGSSITTAQITSAGTVEIKFKTGTGTSEKEFRINLHVNYYGVPQFNGADVPSNIVITESNKNDVVTIPNGKITDIIWYGDGVELSNVPRGTASVSLATLQASGKTSFTLSMDDGTSNALADGKPGGETKYSFSITPLATTTPVASVTLNESSKTLEIGNSFTLNATVLPATATNKAVIWSTSDPGKASISSTSGPSITVNALAAGTTTIKVRTVDGNHEASCLVTVNPPATTPVASVTLNESSKTLEIGNSFTLNATVLPATATNKAVIWSTSDPGKASISSTSGPSITVNALAAGTTTIKVRTVDGNHEASCLVTVNPPTSTLSATLASTTNVAAAGGIAGVNVVSNTNWSITTSGLPSWVTLSTSSGTNNGTVNVTLAQNTGASPRTVTLTFTAGALTRTVTITQNGTGTPPTPPTPPTPSTPTLSLSIEVIRSSGNREMEEVEVSATGDWYIRTPDWISATPSSGRGNRTVTFRIEENTTGVEREAKVTVTSGSLSQTVKVYQAALNPKPQKKVAKLILSDTSVVLKGKAFYHLTVDVLPIDATSKDIVWKSSDPTIATVVNGHVTILKKGEVTITVKALDGSGVSASCKIDIQSTVGNELYPEEPRVWSDGNILYIRLVKPEQVSVYTTNGQLVLRQKMNGDSAVSLSSGIYFVRIGDQETKKVAIY